MSHCRYLKNKTKLFILSSSTYLQIADDNDHEELFFVNIESEISHIV